MVDSQSKSNKGPFAGIVRGHRRIGRGFYRVRLEFGQSAGAAFGESDAGQFVQLDLSQAALPPGEVIPAELRDCSERKILLRRPFSFADVEVKNGKTFVEILYSVAGPASLRMTTLSKDDTVSAIGPLGNGFRFPEEKKMALIVAGGMGAGPLIHLAKELTMRHPQLKMMAFAGAKTKEDLPFERRLDAVSQEIGFSLAEFARYAIESQTATDDGSAGFKGFVTDCLCDWLEKNKSDSREMIIYSCGPEVMLAKVAEIAKQRNIDCQVSMERRMACGIGICQSCAVECIDENGEKTYKLCCKDGPVFDAKEVIFNF